MREISLGKRVIHADYDFFVKMSEATGALNEYRKSMGMGPYNFRQWLSTKYVKDMIYTIENEKNEASFKVKDSVYCNPAIFINMIISSCPDYKLTENEWIYDYLTCVYSFDGYTYKDADTLAIGTLWKLTSKNARFIEEVKTLEDLMEGVENKDAVYSLFFDMSGTFYYNWEVCIKVAKKMLGES